MREALLAGLSLALALTPTVEQVNAAPAGVPLVVTQAPRAKGPPRHWDPAGLVRADAFVGARLVVVSSNGPVRVLSTGFASACDPNVSFDGERVLFSGQRTRESRWRIWEIGANGQGLRAVTPEGMDARSPTHLSWLFTLDSPEPWLTFIFVGRDQRPSESGRRGGSSLYNARMDGSEVRELTFNPNHNFDPFQTWDGRVLYAAERHPNQPGLQPPRIGLYAMHLEGADLEFFAGRLGRRFQQMPCAAPGGFIVFVESDQATWDGSGQLSAVDQSRPQATYRRLTDDPRLRFLYPAPSTGNQLLVSRRDTAQKDNAGIFLFDADRRSCERVFDTPEFDELQAVLIQPRPSPDGHSTVVNTATNTGVFYCLNSYTADPRMAPHLTQGTIKRVRLFEGVLAPSAKPAPGSPAPYLPRRLIGEAPVETDGSFNVEVPSSTPLLLQTVDDRGLAIATCGWIWVQPKETRGCIGCHEDPELIPENEYALALRRPSNRLTLPPEQRRTIGFRQDIAPILQQHCANSDCHGAKSHDLYLPLASPQPSERDLALAYVALMVPAERSGRHTAPPNIPAPGRYVDPGRARTSWLTWQLAGTNTSRPWDGAALRAPADRRVVHPMPPPTKAPPLSHEQLRTIAQWIDMGAQFDPKASLTPTAATPHHP